jgi:hypothetical protein
LLREDEEIKCTILRSYFSFFQGEKTANNKLFKDFSTQKKRKRTSKMGDFILLSSLSIRNWLIGYYIVEYEQKGEDKARYGNNLLDILSTSLSIKGLSVTNLKLNRLFYIAYPQIRQTVSDELQNSTIGIRQTLSDELSNNSISIVQPPSYEAQLAENIINRLSFSHITLLLPIDDPLKRAFYSIEAIKGTWSVREAA